MLKHRLFFGTLMALIFTAIVILDGWLDGGLTVSVADDSPVQGTFLWAFIGLLIVLGQLELKKLAAGRNLRIFTPISIMASILLSGTWYWPQVIDIARHTYVLFLGAFALMGLLLYQYLGYGSSGVLANCGASYFCVVYLGLLSGFVVGMRIDFGLWPVIMFVFVVKSADIGAYAVGSFFGKHRFSPRISPSKTWEGMVGAAGAGAAVAFSFACIFDIMVWWWSIIFGICFAFIGQLGDLAESMLKRDAEQKDSASNVPGFGGILDIIDSPLLAAPFGYLFFMCCC